MPDYIAGFALADGLLPRLRIGTLIAAIVQKDDDLVGGPDKAFAWNTWLIELLQNFYLRVFKHVFIGFTSRDRELLTVSQ